MAGLTTMVSDLPSKVSSLVSQSNIVINARVTSHADFETIKSQQELGHEDEAEAMDCDR